MITKDQYYLEVAQATAKRSHCIDKQVGCVLVDQYGRIIATGYNGYPRGVPHCSWTERPTGPYGPDGCRLPECEKIGPCPVVHAEQNAVIMVNPNEVVTCYSTLEPCIDCTKMLMNTTCQRVVFLQLTNPGKSGKGLWLYRANNLPASWHQLG